MTFRHRDARRVVTKHEGESMTETHHQEACDVHNILDKYTRTRDASLLARSQPYFADVTSAPDYIAAQEQIANANSLFEELPSDVRADCKNDPAVFLDKMENDPDYAAGVYGESMEALKRLSGQKPSHTEPENPEPVESQPQPAPDPDPEQ